MTRDEVDDALASSKRMAFAYARHHVPPRPPEETPASRAGPTPLVDPSAVPEVLRAVLLEDGCVKVNFRDNDVVCLDPTGTAFTVHTAAGETTRQLSEFVVSRFARKLRRALEFRNAHADVPFFPAVLSARASHAATFRCDARVSVARWSRCARDARRRKLLTNLEGGAVALESIDGIARVVLSAHGLVAHVTFPLLYAVRDADSDSDSGSRRGDDDDVGDATREIRRRLVHDYAWHTQTFAADACPERWAFPVALLTGVVYGDDEVEGDGKIEGDDGIEGDDENASAGSATILPASATASPRAPPSLWVDEGDEVEAEWWASASIAGYPDARGSSSAARRRGRRPATERVPGATQWTIRAKTSRGGVPWGARPRRRGRWGRGRWGWGRTRRRLASVGMDGVRVGVGGRRRVGLRVRRSVRTSRPRRTRRCGGGGDVPLGRRARPSGRRGTRGDDVRRVRNGRSRRGRAATRRDARSHRSIRREARRHARGGG